MSEWISVNDRLPPNGEIVLVSYPQYRDENGDEFIEGVGCAYRITFVRNHYWFRSDGTTFGELGLAPVEPVAWMPLPEPEPDR